MRSVQPAGGMDSANFDREELQVESSDKSIECVRKGSPIDRAAQKPVG
jgi:hypothetical protein